MAESSLRGHAIVYVDGEWLYKDTMAPSAGNERACGHCGKTNTPEGYDGCIGRIEGAVNACCGHGNPLNAYIQRTIGDCVRGDDAIRDFEQQRLAK